MSASRARRWRRALAGAAVALSLPLARAQAQHDPAPPGPEQRVEGQVILGGAGAHDPVPGVWVVLHRLGEDAAGPLDSMRTGADGRYRFRFRRTGDEGALYFTAASYGGIAYFAPPFRGARTEGEAAEIMVFDTTSAVVPFRIEGRHFVVSRAVDGAREVMEVYELSNDTSVTVVARGERPVWSAPVPSGISQFVAGEGGSARGALEHRGDRVELFAPVAPGIRQLSFSYRLPADRFPVSVTLGEPARVLEVLVEEGEARVAGAGLKETQAGPVDGRRFRRFLAQDVASGASFRVDPGASSASRRPLIIGVVVAAGAIMAGALVVALRRR